MGAASAGGAGSPRWARSCRRAGRGGRRGGLALARWRVSPALVGAVAGLAALGGGSARVLAAPLFAGAAWLPEQRAQPGPEFSPVVLAALLAYAATALDAARRRAVRRASRRLAAALATVTVLTGMARAGLTIIDRLRASQRQAVTDDLTGLGNRRHLLARLEEAIADADGEVALLLIDLDGFKELNDTLGHEAGDEVLRQIGPRLEEALREGDTLARLGGDEFAVVLAPGRRGDGQRRRPAAARGAGALVRASAASACTSTPASASRSSPSTRDDALGLLQRADVAMYEAKRTRTGHEVYLPERDHHCRRRLELLGELRDGLADGQLVLHYQPKAEIATGEVRGVEALVRWAHPRRGLLMPADFLPLADHTRARPLADRVRARSRAGGDRRAPARRARPLASRSTSARPTCSTSGCRRTSTGVLRAAPLPGRRACGSRSPRTS